MINKCPGCGAVIQTLDPKKPGYIREDVYLRNQDDFLCERCFNISHYNKNIKVNITEQDFIDIANNISKQRALIVNIIDVFDLEGTIIKDVNTLFPKSKVLLIANKYDLFLKSNKPEKIKKYVDDYLAYYNIIVEDVIISSCKKEDNAVNIINKIMKYVKNGEEVYFFGTTNVGKSTLINSIINLDNEEGKNINKITVSNTPGTTLDVIKIKLRNGLIINDTPGILNKHQVTCYLETKSLSKVMPKKFVKPVVFQLNPKQTLFVGGFAWISFIEGERSSFVMNFSNMLTIHRCKLENTEEFYKEHLDDILKLPNKKERKALGKTVEHYFEFDGKTEIAISGLGFIGLTGKGKVKVTSFENIKVTQRSSII